MKRFAVAVVLLVLSGCASYKELSPKPQIQPAERGYIELKNNKENFVLEKDKKYFIEFPPPPGDNFFIVLRTQAKSALTSYVASSFDDGAPMEARLIDAVPKNDSLAAYPVDARVPHYYWVVDAVRNDVELNLQYRYVPRWRFTFEQRYVELREQLSTNRTNPATYNAIGPATTFESLDVPQELSTVESKLMRLKDEQNELQAVAQLFPPNIASMRDTAYDNYLSLRSDLAGEVMLQENYAGVLRVVNKEQTTRGNTGAFLGATQVFLDFFDQREHQRPPVVARVSSILLARLTEATSYYDGLLRAKNDYSSFTPTPPIENVVKLYRAMGAQQPSGFSTLLAFVNRFNFERAGLASADAKLAELDQRVAKDAPWGSDSLYTELLSIISAARAALPETNIGQFEGRGQYACTRSLITMLVRTQAKITALEDLYKQAAGLVGDINTRQWASAERRERDLFASPNFNDVPAALVQRKALATHLDWEIFSRVKQATEQRTDAFITANLSSITNVPALYKDSAFVPVYTLTFSPGGDDVLRQRKKQIGDFLNDARHLRFPGSAIKLLYADFIRDSGNKGVDRARAIADHGKEYKGTDPQILTMVTECDVEAPKWITKPKEYRKVYALPVTSNHQGDNEYMIRVRLQIPTEAQFPVYDVHVKLPKEIAETSGSASWYRSITIDKTPIKNEGRFRITSPTAENNYESLISPVQMDREGKHILEIRFSYPGYRVFEISTLAQVPIIRKN